MQKEISFSSLFEAAKQCIGCMALKVRPFCLKYFFAYKRNKANLDPFHIHNFASLFSLLFAYFCFKFFASLHFSNFCSEAKQSEAKFKYIFLLFSLFFHFFPFFPFFLFFSFHFDFFAYFTFVLPSDFWCFASKWIIWNQAFFRFQAKRNFRFSFKFRFRSESEGAP